MLAAFSAWIACHASVMRASSAPGLNAEAIDQRESPGATVT